MPKRGRLTVTIFIMYDVDYHVCCGIIQTNNRFAISWLSQIANNVLERSFKISKVCCAGKLMWTMKK